MSTQKRISAPRTYNIKRKISTWITRISPGPHNKNALPLNVLLRDIIGVARNMNEVKKILNQGKVLVDGKVRKSLQFPAGFLDVVSIPLLKKYYRVVYDNIGRFKCIVIPKTEAGLKIVMIKRKIRREKDYQLTTNDGRTIIVKLADGKKYKVCDSLVIKVPSQDIVKHLPFAEKSIVYVTGGKQVGKIGKLKSVNGKSVELMIGKEDHRTVKNYVFIIGTTKEEVKLE